MKFHSLHPAAPRAAKPLFSGDLPAVPCPGPAAVAGQGQALEDGGHPVELARPEGSPARSARAAGLDGPCPGSGGHGRTFGGRQSWPAVTGRPAQNLRRARFQRGHVSATMRRIFTGSPRPLSLMTFRRRSLTPLAAPPIGRRAFTMIELLVVLVIILIVAGLVIVGITSAMSGTRDNATVTRLQMLDGFMAAYQNADNARAGGMGNTEAKRLPEALKAISDPAVTQFYSTVDSGADDAAVPARTNNPLSAPLPLPPAAPSATPPYLTSDPERYPAQFNEDNWVLEPAVARTQAVLRRLLTVPANQSAFSTVSEDGKTLSAATSYDGQPSLLSYAAGTGASGPLDPPLLVDGFGNVIIFVPATGLTGLAFSDGSRNVTMRAANGRAFWASAGADGMFAGNPGADGTWGNADDVPGADDNVYSTQVIRP